MLPDDSRGTAEGTDDNAPSVAADDVTVELEREEDGEPYWTAELEWDEYRIEREYFVNDQGMTALVVEERYYFAGTLLWENDYDQTVTADGRTLVHDGSSVEEWVTRNHTADPSGHIRFAYHVHQMVQESPPKELNADRS